MIVFVDIDLIRDLINRSNMGNCGRPFNFPNTEKHEVMFAIRCINCNVNRILLLVTLNGNSTMCLNPHLIVVF